MYQRKASSGPTLAGPADEANRARGFAETVRDYVGQELLNHDEAERTAILGRLEALFGEAGA